VRAIGRSRHRLRREGPALSPVKLPGEFGLWAALKPSRALTTYPGSLKAGLLLRFDAASGY